MNMEAETAIVLFALVAALGLMTVLAVDIMLTTQKAEASFQSETKARQDDCIPFDSSIANLATSEVRSIYGSRHNIGIDKVTSFVINVCA